MARLAASRKARWQLPGKGADTGKTGDGMSRQLGHVISRDHEGSLGAGIFATDHNGRVTLPIRWVSGWLVSVALIAVVSGVIELLMPPGPRWRCSW
jgi:hypothetical protein